MPQDFPQKLATAELGRYWLSIIGTRPILIAGTSWERSALLGAACSAYVAGSATM
jgi:hypothetical protein